VKIDWIKRAEWAVGILLSLTVLFLLAVRATHAGALWRDECGALQLARLPTFTDVVKSFRFESFPLPFFATLRAYTEVFGASDAALRCFGLAVGLALICTAWFNSRVISADVPLIFLALAGLNATFLVWGTTIRGYGLGSVLITLAFGLTAKLLLRPKRVRLVATCLACLVSAQFLYFNIVLVAAIAAGAIAAFLFRGRMNLALAALGIAAVCAVSYIPYLHMYSEMDWNIVLKSPSSLARLWQGLSAACGEPASIMPVVWRVVFLASFVGAIWRLIIIRHARPFPEFDFLLLALVASVAAISIYYVFLRLLSYPPDAWYYLALLCVGAAAIDLIIATLSRFLWIRLLRLGFVVAALLAIPLAVLPEIVQRQTNIDIVAKKLQQNAAPNDLIVVNPWSVGVSFNWYYRGQTRWLTVPAINEHRGHRYDLVKAKMMESFPLDDLEHEISATLRSGNRIWFVGGMGALRAGEVPLFPLAAPDPQFGWSGLAYRYAWSQQLLEFIRQHALRGSTIIRPGTAVCELENVPLSAAEGWRN
jgi:hypothetical protein